MTTDEVLAVLAARGLRVELNEAGQPRLVGPGEQATPALLRTLRWHRVAIIQRLATRRIVLADGTVARLWKAGKDYEVLAEERAARPGQALWMQAYNQTAGRWETFAGVRGDSDAATPA